MPFAYYGWIDWDKHLVPIGKVLQVSLRWCRGGRYLDSRTEGGHKEDEKQPD